MSIFFYRMKKCLRQSPYVHTFETFAKARWVDCNILDVLKSEFGAYPSGYWLLALARGFVRVNGSIISADYKIRSNDKLMHRTHRHEATVYGEITIVGETNDLVAVNKPASLPMQPCGAYRFNSLEFLLRLDPELKQKYSSTNDLHIVHRLDRVTSGLVILAKTKAAAASISKLMREKKTLKIYLARVKGNFCTSLAHLPRLSTIDFNSADLLDNQEEAYEPPQKRLPNSNQSTWKTEKRSKKSNLKASHPPVTWGSPSEVSATESISNKVGNEASESKIGRQAFPVGYLIGSSDLCNQSSSSSSSSSCSSSDSADSSLLEAAKSTGIWIQYPTGIVNRRDCVYGCSAEEGKQSLSHFRQLWYCEETDTSLVECRPYTGRTHQLRLHLQLCGYPIANDPFYGGDQFFQSEERRAKAAEALETMKQFRISPLSKLPTLSQLRVDGSAPEPETEAESFAAEDNLKDSTLMEIETEEQFLKRHCKYCQQAAMREELESILQCDEIWLHSLKYATDSWTFETPYPEWAFDAKAKVSSEGL